MFDASKFTVDTPVPYRISDLTSLIDERMGKLENKRDIGPYRNLKTRFEILSLDSRYAFMFGSLTVYDGMAQILSRIFRVPVNNKPITILELTGLPTEIVNVVVSVLCRMTFDFALWSEGKVPVTLVCEEAHRYVPANPTMGFEPCKRAIAKIAKEGRKYGASLCIVTQRPAEIDPTILSQCNTVFALRMSNDRDQAIVQSSISDTGSGLMEFLPALGQREAIAFGEGVALPVRIRFDELPKHALPRSSSARFTEMWQKSIGDEGFLDQVVERWRHSASGASGDQTQNTAMFAEAMGISGAASADDADGLHLHGSDDASAIALLPGVVAPPRREGLIQRRDQREHREIRQPIQTSQPPPQPIHAPAASVGGASGGSFRSLRDRLNQKR
jgi:DNA helicase HerA-like ATPase